MKKELLLICYDRPHYLRQVVDSIKALKGLDEWTVTVSIDAPVVMEEKHSEVMKIAREISDKVSVADEHLDCNRHIHNALSNVADPQGAFEEKVVLYVEDDIVLAPDTLEWCLENALVMKANDRIKCMTLLGENQGDAHVAYRNWHGFKCHRWFNGWGNLWLTGKLAEVLTHWPASWDDSNTGAWDGHLLGAFLDNRWLSLTPLLGRVRNIGATGRFITGPEEFRRRTRDFWAGSDFTKPVTADFR